MKGDDSRLTSVSEKLDSITLDVMKTMELVGTLRRQLDEEMSHGFISLAKSRYSMGNKSVSVVQHDTRDELEAIIRVSETFEVINLPTVVQKEVQKTVPVEPVEQSPTSQKSCQSKTDDQIKLNNLRNRKNNKSSKNQERAALLDDGNEEDSNVISVNETKTITELKTVSRDPLRMFGLLVPQSLRQAKTCFQRCINVVCELSSAQIKLEQLRQEYKQLKCEKETLTSIERVEL